MAVSEHSKEVDAWRGEWMVGAEQKQQEGRGVRGMLGGRGGLSEKETLELLWREERNEHRSWGVAWGQRGQRDEPQPTALRAWHWGPPCLV